ncbi:hypothetical protein BS17DRAFT_820915 [Gyrodon lividus]|nr:hypothetical protein BS17DRAFT_820915 [Gyrodon lividus]
MLDTKRKPRDKPTNRPPQTSRQNLTLADWLFIYAYIDAHPDTSQADIVEYFRMHQEGVLIFTQSTLSHKPQERSKMEARANDNPIALSSK